MSNIEIKSCTKYVNEQCQVGDCFIVQDKERQDIVIVEQVDVDRYKLMSLSANDRIICENVLDCTIESIIEMLEDDYDFQVLKYFPPDKYNLIFEEIE